MAAEYVTKKPVTLDLHVDESVYNAVVWYETKTDGQNAEAGRIIVKE